MRYKYELRKGSKKQVCPICGVKGKYKPYVYFGTDKVVPHPLTGRCDRQGGGCNHHLHPHKVSDLDEEYKIPDLTSIKRARPKVTVMPKNIIEKAENRGVLSENNFVLGLYDSFPKKLVDRALGYYPVGTDHKWRRQSTVFFLRDENGRDRGAKVIQYNREALKRVKGMSHNLNWLHTIYNLKDNGFELGQVMYGLHRLNQIPCAMPIGIVESEKTAIIASIWNPDICWMAVGSMDEFRTDGKNKKLVILRGKTIYAFPDNEPKARELWKKRAIGLNKVGFNISLKIHSETLEGEDLADTIIRLAHENKLFDEKAQIKPKSQNDSLEKELGCIIKEFTSPIEDGIWTLYMDKKSEEIEVCSPSGDIYNWQDYEALYKEPSEPNMNGAVHTVNEVISLLSPNTTTIPINRESLESERKSLMIKDLFEGEFVQGGLRPDPKLAMESIRTGTPDKEISS